MDYTTTSCFGCKAPLSGEVGEYYCAKCIAKQTEAQQREARAFDAFHRFADSRSSSLDTN